jgi:rod shape-determining protein MreB
MMMSNDIGIDLGTASILVYIKGKGVVLKEPSVVALDRETNKVITFGEEARLMIGRTPGNIVAVRPLRKGVISDYTVTEKMLKYFINKAVGKRTLRKPRIAVCIPSGATEVERKLRMQLIRQVPVRSALSRSRLRQRSVQESISPRHAET